MDLRTTELAELERVARRVEALARGAWMAVATGVVAMLVLAAMLLVFGRDGQQVIRHHQEPPPVVGPAEDPSERSLP